MAELQTNFDVSERSGLPSEVRKYLLDCPRPTWTAHPRYHGKAEFFIGYHTFLRAESEKLGSELEKILDSFTTDVADNPDFRKAEDAGLRLIQYAQHHHRIEDANYFPMFAQMHPKLRGGLELLDSDHRALSSALDNMGRTLRKRVPKEDAYGSVAIANDRARELDRLLKRHLFDEEEIIIPIFLGVQ
ncbi:MAG: hemerythrin domain-containing protein [Kofleriaceae bacterium]|nr:hemerythrin domain-containing protein [Kofleriaceae bacterium]